jgi:hypothetical protein
MTDPLWNDYVGAVTELGQLPGRRDHLRGAASNVEQESYRRAQAELDAEARRCDAWDTQARRAIENAEAKLVSAQVLVPNPAEAPPATGSPAELAAAVRQAEQDLDADLASLTLARRRAKDEAIKAALAAKQRAELRRGIAIFAAVGAAVVLAIIAVAVLSG